MERSSFDGSELGLALGRLGGCVSSLSMELTDGTSPGESAPRVDECSRQIILIRNIHKV